ncbi:MAG: hypothetical protein WKG07_45205 [Hymenobacter sp.]
MDVGHPSNFVRILELFDNEHAILSRLLSGYTVSDADTSATIRRVAAEHGYLLDPHGAVAFFAPGALFAGAPGRRGLRAGHGALR